MRTLPSLRSIYLNLFQEDQVDYIMRTLEDLEFLNGLKVERDILDDDEDEEDNLGIDSVEEEEEEYNEEESIN